MGSSPPPKHLLSMLVIIFEGLTKLLNLQKCDKKAKKVCKSVMKMVKMLAKV